MIEGFLAEQGITQMAFAQQVGVEAASVSRWLAGAIPSESHISSLARALRRPEDDVAASISLARRKRAQAKEALTARRVDELQSRLENLEREVRRLGQQG